jgi:hypothetical protein
VLFCHVAKNWIIQENWYVLVNTGKEDRNSEFLRLYMVFVSRQPKHEVAHISPRFLKLSSEILS